MKKDIINIVIVGVFILAATAIPAFSVEDQQSCIVIGEEVDAAKGAGLYMEAVSAWRQGLRQKALDLYEAALLADRSVLSKPDEGMAQALLDRYRELTATASPSAVLLCRQGFLENIVSGNLEEAIAVYRKAAAAAESDAVKEAAEREAARLQAQLDHIKNWQTAYQRKTVFLQRQEEAELELQEKLDAIDDRIAELEDERAELEERLAYLRQQESESSEQLMTSMRRASRYRRIYYYPGRENHPDVPVASYPGPAVGPLPSPPPGAPKPLNEVNEPPQPAYPNYDKYEEGSPLWLYYRNRNAAKQNETALKNIRAEITGIERRIEKIDKLIEKAREEREKILSSPPLPSDDATEADVVEPASVTIRE